MSYDNPQTHGLFEELLAGAKAVQELPTVKAELDRTKSESEFKDKRLDEFRSEMSKLNATNGELQAKLTAMEEAHKQATFREQEVRAKLETLVTSFRGVIGEVKAAADLANELVEEPKPVPTLEGHAGQAFSGDVNITEGSNIHPFEVEASHSTSDGTAPLDRTSGVSTQGGFEDELHTVEVEHTSSPFVSSQTDQSAPAPLQSHSGGSATPEANATSTSEPVKEYWLKPTPMKWRDWVAQGGHKAPWVRDDDLDYSY